MHAQDILSNSVIRKFAPHSSTQALAASFYATDEAATGGKWAAGLAVVAVGGLFAVFAIVSRGKGRRTARVLKEGYGAADPSEALLPVA